MQVEPKNNYNVLGRMGPTQPRPEYRPKSSPEEAGPKAGEGGGAQKDSFTRSGRSPAAATSASAAAQVPEGRLSLQAAKALTKATAEAIADLAPMACNQGPHGPIGREAGLMYPRYV